MNKRWEISNEILGTLCLDSASAVQYNVGTPQQTNFIYSGNNITYAWNLPDWAFVFNHTDNPGAKWNCTHEFFGDFMTTPNFVSMTTTTNPTFANSGNQGYTQSYLIQSNLSGSSYNTTTLNSNVINIAKHKNVNLGMVYTTQVFASMTWQLEADPRDFILDNPSTLKQILITFSAPSYVNGWNLPAHNTITGTDYFTAGKHIFTFRRLKPVNE
jgi:hypothetical protein